MLETLLRQRQATRISLKRLPVQGVDGMLGTLSGKTPPPSLARVIFQETEGNPFFVEEVYRHLAEEGKLFDSSGGWRRDLRADELEVPEGVRLVVGRRLKRLGENARRVLTTGAVIGRSFSLRLLEAVETANPDAALEAVEEAEKAHLAVAEGTSREPRYRFVHELIRQTLEDTVSLPRRQRLHARIAEAMERLYGNSIEKHVSALAHHLYQSGAAADPEKTIRFLMMASKQARSSAAHEDSLAHVNNALSLVEGERGMVPADLFSAQAGALRCLARIDEAEKALESAIALYTEAGDSTRAAESCIELNFVVAWRGDTKKAIDVARHGMKLAEKVDQPALRCRLLFTKAIAHSVRGEVIEGQAILRQARELEATLPPGAMEGFSDLCETHMRGHSLEYELGLAAMERARRTFRAIGNLWNEVDLDYMPGFTYIYMGNPAAALSWVEEHLPRALRVGHHNVAWCLLTVQHSAHLLLGNFDQAEQQARDTYTFGEGNKVGWHYMDVVIKAMFLAGRGRIDESLPILEKGIGMEPRCHSSGYARSVRMLLLALEGDLGALRDLHHPELPLAVAGQANTQGAWVATTAVGLTLGLFGRDAEAANLLPVLEELASKAALMWLFVPHASCAGVVAGCAGQWDKAEDYHQKAEAAAAAQCPGVLPMARELHARTLIKRGGTDGAGRARLLLDEARAGYERMGMSGYGKRVSGILPGLAATC
jgi:tetratricopeptide (TPR) repeat protein